MARIIFASADGRRCCGTGVTRVNDFIRAAKMIRALLAAMIRAGSRARRVEVGVGRREVASAGE